MRIGVSCSGAERLRVGFVVAVIAALLLGACSTTENAGGGVKSFVSALNPLNWFSDKEPDYAAGKTLVAEKPRVPGAAGSPDETRPPLSSVPDRPRELTTSRAKAERKSIRDGLAADAENARHAEEALRARQPGIATPDAARSPDRVAGANAAGAARTPPVPVAGGPVAALPTVSVPAESRVAARPAAPQPAAEPVRQASLTPPDAVRSVQVATIYFGDGSAGLTRLDRQIVRQVAEVARRTGGVVRIVGHSSVGDPAADPGRQQRNYRISLKRANAVAAELRRLGVSADRVQVTARGDSEPVYLETAATGSAGNRRAEVYLDYTPGT